MLTEGGWLAGPKEVTQRKFSDLVTGEIKGDFCSLWCAGKANRAREARKHLSPTSPSGSITPDAELIAEHYRCDMTIFSIQKQMLEICIYSISPSISSQQMSIKQQQIITPSHTVATGEHLL